MQQRRWTVEDSARLAELWPTKKTEQAIADEMGFSIASISIKAAQMDLPPRRTLSEARRYLLEEANKRGISTRELQAKIIQTAAKDRLVPSILDDAVAEAERAEAEPASVAPPCETEWLAKLRTVDAK